MGRQEDGSSAHCRDGALSLANSICAEQNNDLQLERLAAQRALYSQAKGIFAWHAILSTIVAGALSATALFIPSVKPYAVVWGSALAVLDTTWLTPWQKRLREAAALIQESFDCDVLGLPWQQIKVGKQIDHETVVEWANRYRRTEPSFASLRNWYPTAVCRVPLFLARVVCQRANPWWESKQRRTYAFVLIAGVVALLIVLLLIGVARSVSLPDLLLTTVVPLMAGLTFALRQYKENIDAAMRLEKLKDEAGNLWKQARGGASQQELATACRALQDELFDHRKRNVPVFDCMYRRLRSAHEEQMQDSAEQLVSELESARANDGGSSWSSV